MAKNFVVGIDIGTQNIRVGVANGLIENEISMPKMVAFGMGESKGLRQGHIVEKKEVIKSLSKALEMAEKNLGERIKSAIFSVGSIGLGSAFSSSEIMVSRADLEVTELDLEKIINTCENNIPTQISLNKKILHTIPLAYKLDGKIIIGNPVGIKGSKLEVKCLFITISENYLNNIIEIAGEVGLDISEVVASPIASSLVLLSKQQKKAGCILVNIGSETTSFVVYENNMPISLEALPVGSTSITNDIALGLKIPLEEAEHVKLGGITTTSYPRKKLEEIMEARLGEIFEMIDSHLRKIGKSGLLPAGAIFTGGGSGLNGLDDLAKSYLRLPARIGVMPNENAKNNVKDSAWSAVYGLCLLGLSSESEERYAVKDAVRKTGKRIRKFFRQFMP